MLILAYLRWHYGDGFRRVLQNAGARAAAFWHFFSIPLLLPTFFAPWHRIGESYRGRGFDLGAFITAVIWNSFSRIIGAVMRLVLMCIGVAAAFLSVVWGLVAALFWIALPALIIAITAGGIAMLANIR